MEGYFRPTHYDDLFNNLIEQILVEGFGRFMSRLRKAALWMSFIVSVMTSDRPAAPATIRSSMHGHWLTVHFFFLL